MSFFLANFNSFLFTVYREEDLPYTLLIKAVALPDHKMIYLLTKTEPEKTKFLEYTWVNKYMSEIIISMSAIQTFEYPHIFQNMVNITR